MNQLNNLMCERKRVSVHAPVKVGGLKGFKFSRIPLSLMETKENKQKSTSIEHLSN